MLHEILSFFGSETHLVDLQPASQSLAWTVHCGWGSKKPPEAAVSQGMRVEK
jgi:hypothetical protein